MKKTKPMPVPAEPVDPEHFYKQKKNPSKCATVWTHKRTRRTKIKFIKSIKARYKFAKWATKQTKEQGVTVSTFTGYPLLSVPPKRK